MIWSTAKCESVWKANYDNCVIPSYAHVFYSILCLNNLPDLQDAAVFLAWERKVDLIAALAARTTSLSIFWGRANQARTTIQMPLCSIRKPVKACY
jgi:hypothetical protein